MLFGPHNIPRKLSFLLLLPVVHGYSAGRAVVKVVNLLILVAFFQNLSFDYYDFIHLYAKHMHMKID